MCYYKNWGRERRSQATSHESQVRLKFRSDPPLFTQIPPNLFNSFIREHDGTQEGRGSQIHTFTHNRERERERERGEKRENISIKEGIRDQQLPDLPPSNEAEAKEDK